MKFQRIVALGIRMLLILSTPLWAANPFTPPEDIQLLYQALYPDLSEPVIDYKMYMQMGSKMIALLNNTFVSEGDSFKGMKVISVNKNRVILLALTGEKRIITIGATEAKLQKIREIMNEVNQ